MPELTCASSPDATTSASACFRNQVDDFHSSAADHGRDIGWWLIVK